MEKSEEASPHVPSKFLTFQKYRETTKLTGGWVDSLSPSYHPDRTEFLVLAPVLDGGHGHFRHIMRVQVWGVDGI